MAEGNWQNPFGISVTLPINNTTYISDGSLQYVKIGRIVVFSATYTMKTDIITSVAGTFSGLPKALYESRYLIKDSAEVDDNNFARSALVTQTYLAIKGPHTQGHTYTTSGAYIAE